MRLLPSTGMIMNNHEALIDAVPLSTLPRPDVLEALRISIFYDNYYIGRCARHIELVRPPRWCGPAGLCREVQV